MSEVLKTRSDYLVELEKDIADELDIAAGNSYNFATSYLFSKMKEQNFENKSFDEFSDFLNQLPDDDATLFGPALDENNQVLHEREDYDFEYDLDIKRLRTLVEVVQNFLENITVIRKTEAYKKLKMLIPNKDVTLLALIVEEMRMYALDMLEVLKRNEPYLLDEFKPVIKKMKALATKIKDDKSRINVVNDAYELEALLADYFETLIDKTFEWDQEQINRANWFVNVLTEFEANWYFLLLLREERIVKLDLLDNPNVNSTIEFYKAKQELLSEGNVMKEAGIAYNGKHAKNHKK